jgi:hypothetical protein
VEVQCLSTAVVEQLHPSEAELIEFLQRQIRNTEEIFEINRIRSADERLLRLLFWLGERFGQVNSRGLSGDNEVGRSATSSLAGGVSAGDPCADAQGPGDAGTTDEPPTQPVHGETTRWQQPGGCCRSGGHFSAQCPPD